MLPACCGVFCDLLAAAFGIVARDPRLRSIEAAAQAGNDKGVVAWVGSDCVERGNCAHEKAAPGPIKSRG